MSLLKGKTALVTGSTSGIGLAMAIGLAKQGANIMVNGFGEKDAAIAAIKMAFIRQQASLSHQIDNQHLLGSGTFQIENNPLQIEE